MAWKLALCPADDEDQLNTLLAASWEPFAVTETESIATVWLRRSADPSEARIERVPRRSLDVRQPL
jgi:hypothetical protein